MECVVNLNTTWLGFVFVLISFVYMHDAVTDAVSLLEREVGKGSWGVGGVKIGRPRSRGKRISEVDEQGG